LSKLFVKFRSAIGRKLPSLKIIDSENLPTAKEKAGNDPGSADGYHWTTICLSQGVKEKQLGAAYDEAMRYVIAVFN